MRGDDEPVGRILTRRELIALLGVGGLGLLIGRRPLRAAPFDAHAPFPSCVVRPAQTEGPYFVDRMLKRSDVRGEPGAGDTSAGAPLALGFVVSRVTASGCTPVSGAHVDVWQCDAEGVYSGVRDPSFDTSGLRYLRGYQVTDENGEARFTTIYPGWYPGRTVHVHFKIRTTPAAGRGHEFTSQLYFDDALTDRIHAQAPYASRSGRTRNEADRHFRSGGDQLMLDVREEAGALRGTFEVGLSY